MINEVETRSGVNRKEGNGNLRMEKEEKKMKVGIEENSSALEEVKIKKRKKVSLDTTHVSTSFTMNTMDFTSNVILSPKNAKDTSSMMTTSMRMGKKDK